MESGGTTATTTATRIGLVFFNVTETSQSVGSINVHGTRSTNSFTARSTKGESWVLFVFDFDKGVKDHRVVTQYYL